MKILETQRLILRSFQMTDLDAMAAIDADPKVYEFLPAIGTRENTAAGIQRIMDHEEQKGFSLYAVELKTTHEMIGWIGLMTPSFEAHFTPAIEIGWRLASQHWNTGYATEGAKAVLDYAFTTLGLEEVVSFTTRNNIASRRVMEKIGLHHNLRDDFNHPKLPGHRLEEHVLYRITHSAYLEFNAPTQWAYSTLETQGYDRQEPSTLVRRMPWSQVESISTTQGTVFLKTVSAPFVQEAILLQYLSSHIPNFHLPHCIALNPALHCFLSKDAGHPLRQQLNKDVVEQVLMHYANLQMAAIPFVPELLQIPIPDWRLNMVPVAYEKLLQKNQALLSQDGLTDTEMQKLKTLMQPLSELCAQLTVFGIPETLHHGDFHDNNILFKDRHFTICDWADACVTHPFFALVSWLESASRHHKISSTHPTYQKWVEAYLQPWSSYISLTHAHQALEIAWKIYPILFTLNFIRIHECPGIELHPEFHGYMADALRMWLTS